jgi:hypothetical protein
MSFVPERLSKFQNIQHNVHQNRFLKKKKKLLLLKEEGK